MSLIHWWPLNGNTNDLGISPCTVSGTPAFAANGKIGKCLSSGTLTMPAAATAQVFNKDAVSVCFWLYNGGSTGSIFGTGQTAPPNNRRFTLFQYPTANDLHWSWQNEDSSGPFTDGLVSGAIQSNAWSHICAVWDHGTARIYVNGTQVGTSTGTCTSTNWAYDTIIAEPSSTRYYNDIRIYNHALSAKEVKEISKGLILHYNFEDDYNISPNIFDIENYLSPAHYTNAGTKTTYSSSGFTITATGIDMYIEGMCYSLGATADSNWSLMPVEEGKTYRISYDLVAGENLNKSFICYFNSSRVCVGESAYTGFSFIRYGTTNTYYYDFTVPTGYSIASVSFRLGRQVAVGDFIIAEHWQLRKGTAITSYIPADFSDNKIVIDSSGYGYNGTNNGVTLSDNSISGKFSAQFNGTATSFINAGQGAKVTDEITVSWFGYMTNWANYGRAISCTEGGGWNFESENSKMQWPIYLAGIGYKTCQSIKNLSEFTPGWHLFTGTYDGFTSKLYIDGELQSSVTSGATSKTAIGYAASNSIFIGAEATESATTPTSPYFSGNIADFKIYATALSADDVKAEYNRKAAIDKNGNLFTGEIIETAGSDTKIDKNSFIDSNLFATTMTLEDGSLWAPICVHYVPDGLFKGYYTGRNIWENFGAINDLERPESNQWEFYVMQQEIVDGAFSKYRFKQNVNPFRATWEQVNPSKVGTNVTRISSSKPNNYAGMYWYNNPNLEMCFANESNGNWFGCGIRAAYQGGIPGYNGETVKGWQLVYMRISKHKARMFRNGIMIPTDIIEN